jgi:hypothetical protein
MRLAANTRAFFFLGWLSWWAVAWAVVYVEYHFRAKVWLTPYGFEAWIAMVAPLFAFACADQLVMKHYESVWERFTNNALGPLVLENEAVDRLRDDLRRNLLLRWFAPRKARSLQAQLSTAADWLPALIAPQESTALRFSEAVTNLCCWLLIAGAFAVALAGATRESVAIAIGMFGLALVGLGFHAIKIAARRQAVFDYFAAWRASADEAA